MPPKPDTRGRQEAQAAELGPELSPVDTEAPTFNPEDIATVQAVLNHEADKNKKARAQQREMYAMLKSLTDRQTEQVGGEIETGDDNTAGGSGGSKGPGPFKRSNTMVNEQEQNTLPRTQQYSYHAQFKPDIPKLAKGMTYNEYKQKVTVWQRVIRNSIPKSERAGILIHELPVDDERGGLQTIVLQKHDIEYFDTEDGVDKLMTLLEQLTGTSSFAKMNGFIRKLFAFKQQKGWTISRSMIRCARTIAH